MNPYDAGADPVIDEPSSSNEFESLAEQEETSTSKTWQIPEAEPRDRSSRPLLELVGVFTGNGQDSTAMIREKDGPTLTYRLGDKISGNRELIEIHDSHVLLQNDQYVERLRLRNRTLEPQYRAEELETWAQQLVGDSQGDAGQGGENR